MAKKDDDNDMKRDEENDELSESQDDVLVPQDTQTRISINHTKLPLRIEKKPNFFARYVFVDLFLFFSL